MGSFVGKFLNNAQFQDFIDTLSHGWVPMGKISAAFDGFLEDPSLVELCRISIEGDIAVTLNTKQYSKLALLQREFKKLEGHSIDAAVRSQCVYLRTAPPGPGRPRKSKGRGSKPRPSCF